MVTDEPVRYTLTGQFTPGLLDNGVIALSLYRPFTANTFFEYELPTVFVGLDETGVLQPGLTYEFRVRVNDLLAAGSGNPGPTSESTSYNLQFNVATVQLGDVNLDGGVNLLDVQHYIDLLNTGMFQIEADIDGNGVVNLLDVQPFIDILNTPWLVFDYKLVGIVQLYLN